MSPVNQVTISVPGSTSNCGAGFDSLGMAVNVANRITVSTSSDTSEAQPERKQDARAQTMVADAAALYFKTVKRGPFGFNYRIEGEVPPARGLGSSVTVRAGIIAALDSLSGTGMTRHQLVTLVTELEGHPDNAAASILGGFCVARADPQTGAYIETVRITVPDELVFVTASPLIEVATQVSRAILPAKVPYFDAVRSINSAAYMVAAMATGDYDRLRHAVCDFMHEPYRLPGIPGAREAITAGVRAGALTGWLSGSGSSVMCVSRREQGEVVMAAMREVFTSDHRPCETAVLQADNRGLTLD
ncbi:MAG: homoserine kinase [Cephaloticoccus sp.]|nr:homoserine kinase [Cephaloticoccus sp.]MCF7759414.1 homoserine kinase [Cephaloticoccus sp.]